MLEIAKEMIFCLKNFKSHNYKTNEKDQRIGYQVLDNVVYNAV